MKGFRLVLEAQGPGRKEIRPSPQDEMVLSGEIQTRVFVQQSNLSFNSFELPLKLGCTPKLRKNRLSFLALHQALHGPVQPSIF
jgi:hypothetical protein